MLYKVAICDDEKSGAERISDYLARFSLKTDVEFQSSLFSSGEDLIKRYGGSHDPFDIVFLDMEMKGLNGIQTAERIRSLPEHNVLIAFVTSYPEYMQDSFDVQASQYLLKPLSYNLFEEKLQKMLNYLTDIQTNITVISLKSGETILHLDDIVCIETDKSPAAKSALTVTLTDGELSIRGKMAEFEETLAKNYFLSVHRSVLANMKYIRRFNANTVEFATGKTVELSRRKAASVKEAFSKYMVMRYKR